MRFQTLQIMPDDAQNSRDGWEVHRQRDFRGGENQLDLPELVGRNQLIRLENIMIDPGGRLSSFFQVDTTIMTGAGVGVCLGRNADGQYTAYRAVGDGLLYSAEVDTGGSAVDLTDTTGAAVAGAYISGLTQAVTFLGKRYCANPNPDGTHNGILNLTDATLIPLADRTAKSLHVYLNRLWLINTDGTIQISDNGDALTWDPLNILWLPNQEPALAFVPVQGGAIVYGASSIYAMFGSSYLDISFVPLATGGDRNYTGGYAEVNGTVYILSVDGIYVATLNGAKLLESSQPDYFRDITTVIAADPGTICGVHIKRMQAIYYTWPATLGGTHGLMFYYGSNAYSKAELLLDPDYPYAVALNDRATDFLIGSGPGTVAKSLYPPSDFFSPRISTIQTRHEDCDSSRPKIWQHCSLTTDSDVYGVTLDAFLDGATTGIRIATNINLTQGENVFILNSSTGLASGANFPASHSISLRVTFNNGDVAWSPLVDEDTGEQLTDEDTGAILTDEKTIIYSYAPGYFLIQELKIKYCLSGVDA